MVWCQEASQVKPVPIPKDLAPQVRQSIELGRELYFQDGASAAGTDALLESLGSLEGKGIAGYLTIREGDDNGKPLPSWLVQFFTRESDPRIAYQVHVPMKRGEKPRVEVLAPPAQPHPEILKLFRARQAALKAAQPLAQPVNPVVLPASVIGRKGVLVELLAGTNKPDTVVFGRHYRVIVTADGRRVEEVMPLSKGILELTKEPGVAALTVSHIVTAYPLETHVFASMLHHMPIYVGTERGVWVVNADSIILLSNETSGSPKQ
jgi:hypothetical protein